jgi:hypothetical protein
MPDWQSTCKVADPYIVGFVCRPCCPKLHHSTTSLTLHPAPLPAIIPVLPEIVTTVADPYQYGSHSRQSSGRPAAANLTSAGHGGGGHHHHHPQGGAEISVISEVAAALQQQRGAPSLKRKHSEAGGGGGDKAATRKGGDNDHDDEDDDEEVLLSKVGGGGGKVLWGTMDGGKGKRGNSC